MPFSEAWAKGPPFCEYRHLQKHSLYRKYSFLDSTFLGPNLQEIMISLGKRLGPNRLYLPSIYFIYSECGTIEFPAMVHLMHFTSAPHWLSTIWHVSYFATKINPSLTKPPLKFSVDLTNFLSKTCQRRAPVNHLLWQSAKCTQSVVCLLWKFNQV